MKRSVRVQLILYYFILWQPAALSYFQCQNIKRLTPLILWNLLQTQTEGFYSVRHWEFFFWKSIFQDKERWGEIRGESSSKPALPVILFYFYLNIASFMSARCSQMFYYYTTLIEMLIKYLSWSLWFYHSIVSWQLIKLNLIKQTKKVTSNSIIYHNI